MKETCRWQSRPIRLPPDRRRRAPRDRKSTRLNSSHLVISYAVFCLKKKNSEHARSADFDRRSAFKYVFRDRNVSHLIGCFDYFFLVVLWPSVRVVEQIRSLGNHVI